MWNFRCDCICKRSHCECLDKKHAVCLKGLHSVRLNNVVPFLSCAMMKIFTDKSPQLLQFLLQALQVVLCYTFPSAVNKNEHGPSSAHPDFLASARSVCGLTHWTQGPDNTCSFLLNVLQGHWPSSERQDRNSGFITY